MTSNTDTDPFTVHVNYDNATRLMSVPNNQDQIAGTEGDTESTTVSVLIDQSSKSLPTDCTVSMMFDVNTLDDHVVETTYVDLTYDSTTGRYIGMIPANVFNNTKCRKLPVQLRVKWITTENSTAVNHRYYSLNIITFIVLPALGV